MKNNDPSEAEQVSVLEEPSIIDPPEPENQHQLPFSRLECLIFLMFMIISITICSCAMLRNSTISNWLDRSLQRIASPSNAEIRYSGQISGEFETWISFKCEPNDVPSLSFDYNVITLMPHLSVGTYQFSNDGKEGQAVLFNGQVRENGNTIFLKRGDLISGSVTLKRLPNSKRARVEGEFEAVYPDITIEGEFEFDIDRESGLYNCWVKTPISPSPVGR